MTRWRRALTIVRRLTPFLLAFLRDRRRWVVFGPSRRLPRSAHQRRAERLTTTVAELGPTFIKLAQVFSARADVIPEPYLSAVGTLQDRVPPDPTAEIEEVIRSELGQPVDVLFAGFEREPVAAASLGQVHRARLGGSPVAVKVLRPGVEELVALDLGILFRLIYVLNILFPSHHVRALTAVVREFSVRVREEMDFRREAAHIALFQRHFASETRVRAPRVFDEFTRRRVLVMEWVHGDKVDRLEPRFASGELHFRTLMETFNEVYLRMLLVEGFVHADPHPGNILVESDGTVVLLDWGMVVHLSRSTREKLLRLFLAVARDDLDALLDGMYELGMIDPEVSRAEIREAAQEILAVVERMKELGPRRVQEMVQEIMDTFYAWPLILPEELVYFFRASVLLEGIGFRYDPNFNGLEIGRPVFRSMQGELLRATAKDAGDLARTMLEEARGTFQAARDILRRLEREELRIRRHPRDTLQTERFLLLQVRRLLLSVFALTVAVIASITFIGTRNGWLLAAGLVLSFFMFVFVFLLPSHLLENPFRHVRRLRLPDPDDAPTEPGGL